MQRQSRQAKTQSRQAGRDTQQAGKDTEHAGRQAEGAASVGPPWGHRWAGVKLFVRRAPGVAPPEAFALSSLRE